MDAWQRNCFLDSAKCKLLRDFWQVKHAREEEREPAEWTNGFPTLFSGIIEEYSWGEWRYMQVRPAFDHFYYFENALEYGTIAKDRKRLRSQLVLQD
ncbi:uncharacterized protein [Hemitrygon akajei]|uniref:uncharacterized protein isoform X2 n=1 Tax=Hemitrygon akajei TaxID=2704970 RepID=UPI003BFA3914